MGAVIIPPTLGAAILLDRCDEVPLRTTQIRPQRFVQRFDYPSNIVDFKL